MEHLGKLFDALNRGDMDAARCAWLDYADHLKDGGEPAAYTFGPSDLGHIAVMLNAYTEGACREAR